MRFRLPVTLFLFTAIVVLGGAAPGRGIAGVAAPAGIGYRGPITRVSVSSAGDEGDDHSWGPSLSADGRIVAFNTYASFADDDDEICYYFTPYPESSNCSDIYVHDGDSGETVRVSVASDGTEGNEASYGGSISADGRFVAFTSRASNLVSDDSDSGCFDAYGDPRTCDDVFVHDRTNQLTTRVSLGLNGEEANGESRGTAISADGRFVAFSSSASNLVAGDTNGISDIFVHARADGTTSRVSVASGGSEGNASSSDPVISADGRFVAFNSDAGNLVAGDTNDVADVFVHDRHTGETVRVSVASDGSQGNGQTLYAPAISADGRFVAFTSWADNLVADDGQDCYLHEGNWYGCLDIFVHDRDTGRTTRVSVATDGADANAHSSSPVLSADGRIVAFSSAADNLIEDDTNNAADVFLHDRYQEKTVRVSVSATGSEANNHAGEPALSAEAGVVAFSSPADNLVAGDTNNVCYSRTEPVAPCRDVFIRALTHSHTFLPFVMRP